jgi:hypothetical protein
MAISELIRTALQSIGAAMQAPREYKRVINRIRKRTAKRGVKNGSLGFIDSPWLENILTNSKKNYRRQRAGIETVI